MSLAARDHPRRMTAAEFRLTDELPFDQLIDGTRVSPANPATHRHQRIAFAIAISFEVFARAHPGSGTTILDAGHDIDGLNVFAPDIQWLPDGADLDGGSVAGLVIEVLSPSTRRDDLGRKLELYLAAGVREVWTVDIDVDPITVTVHRPGAEAVVHTATVTTPLIPGWTLDVSGLLAGR